MYLTHKEHDYCNEKPCNQLVSAESSTKDRNNDEKCENEYKIIRKRNWPWIEELSLKNLSRCKPMTIYEEENLLKKLKNIIDIEDPGNVPSYIRLQYRKLYIWKIKRERNIKLFNIDEYIKECVINNTGKIIKSNEVDWDKINADSQAETMCHILSSGPYPDLKEITSSYTSRSLKPFLWCDAEIHPLWIQFSNEIKKRCFHENEENILHSTPVYYSYIRQCHVAAINTLCCRYFWPGIDITESLQYPDFSCVALYKKLIVGFALMVPDVTATEFYISFLFTRPGWRNCGIASFMLYHLIQTCIGKDITLHVAADNPAILLYQKFGFKVEQFIKNYYEKYLPRGTNQTQHALFLRLSR